MSQMLVLGCESFSAEIRAALEGEKDIVFAALPSNCGRPPHTWEQLRPLITPECTRVLVIGRACLAGLASPPADLPEIRLLVTHQCFDLIAPEPLVNHWITSGGYLMTPSWLRDWKGHLEKLGFDPASAVDFFAEFCKRLVLIDTGLDAEAEPLLKAMSKELGIEAERVPVGLDLLRTRLQREIADWCAQEIQLRAEAANRARLHAQADAQATIDMLAQLTGAEDEAQVLSSLRSIFEQLFAPAGWYFLPHREGQLRGADLLPWRMAEAVAEFEKSPETYLCTPNSRSMLLRLGRAERRLGLVVLEELAFPEFRERYLGMALALCSVAALAIEETRNRQRLVEAEKMASLGILVAGVAHEINTPVGISMAAASTLELQGKRIGTAFAARTMKHSELQAFLGMVAAETALITGNLDRIGRSIESFRQIAVEKTPPTRRQFDLRHLIDQVVESQGRGELGEGLQIEVQCPEGLNIESFPGDWATVLGNLYSNSLRHGFRGRARGAINITVECTSNGIELDYRDDGNGLSIDACEHIFDPFFTTDLQKGMGLGMHLVYNLVKHRFGGLIECDRNSASGAHFHMHLPVER